MGADESCKHILVVEPEWDIAFLLQELLTGEGYETEAIQSLNYEPGGCAEPDVDLVILDLSPGQSARGSSIEMFLGTCRAPILCMSTDSTLSSVLASKPRVVGFLPKPFDLDTALLKVRAALARGGAAKPTVA